MSYWSGERLKEEIDNCILGEYDANNVDCASYTLHIGPEIFITPDHYESNPNKNNKRPLAENEAFTIPPGQFAFLLTEEVIKVPNNAIAFISIKAGTKFKGLINVSGFHVDPGYAGRLIFSVFNAGPIPIKMKRGMPLFLIWYADLDRESMEVKNNDPVKDIDLKIIDPIHGPIFSPQAISESVMDFQKQIRGELHAIDKKLTRFLTISSIIGLIVFGSAGYALKDYLTKNNNHSSANTDYSSSKQHK